MVSFQCNGCGDVVKKPKLDTHYARCHAPFDCIDCSTTFHAPAEFKGHTSCITEAEKYQKSLYKAHKGKQNKNQGPVEKGVSNGTTRANEQGRGESKERPSELNGDTQTIDPIPEPPNLMLDSKEVAMAPPEQPKKAKKSKEKKAKSKTVADDEGEKETQVAATDPVPVPLPPSPEKPSDLTSQPSKERRKKNKKKEDPKDGIAKEESTADVQEGDEKVEKAKKKKKAKKDATTVPEDNPRVEAKEGSAMDVDQPNSQHVEAPERKKKKAKKGTTSAVEEDNAPVHDVDHLNTPRQDHVEVSEGKKKKKAKKGTTSVAEEDSTRAPVEVKDSAMDVDQPNVPGQEHGEGSEGKRKKRKRKDRPDCAEEVNVDSKGAKKRKRTAESTK